MKPAKKKKSPGQISRQKRKAGKITAANWRNGPDQPVYRRYTPHVKT